LSHELVSKSIEELAPLLRNQDISPVELTEATLHQAERYNDHLNAYIEIREKEALNAARKAEQEIMKGEYKTALHGIPMALKDNIFFENQITTMGSKIYENFVPHYDATVVKKLKEAGVIFTGRLNLHEFAWGGTTDNPFYGTCRNPWDTQKIPGGSSGGSAAAISADMTVASLGTDTVGSIRIPASACGIVGLKPTYGRVSKHGCFPSSMTLDHVGPMTKKVYDSAALLEVIAGYDYQDQDSSKSTTQLYTNYLNTDISNCVIGINEDYFFKDVDPQIEQIVREGIQSLVNQGAIVKHIDLPMHEYSEYTQLITFISEASTIHNQDIKEQSNKLGEDLRLKLELGQVPSAVEYLQAQQLRERINREIESAFERVDVIISPSLPELLPDTGLGEGSFNDIRFMGPVNLTGLPAVTVPAGLKNGMPVGLQIIGNAFQEKKILNLAYALEQTNPMQRSKPNLTLL